MWEVVFIPFKEHARLSEAMLLYSLRGSRVNERNTMERRRVRRDM